MLEKREHLYTKWVKPNMVVQLKITQEQHALYSHHAKFCKHEKMIFLKNT